MKKLVVLTGSGISAESGFKTFRESNGLWENYDVNKVATPEGWSENQELVLDFYNQLRKKLLEAEPNEGHKGLVELEKYFEVQIITQNIDNLHERAGSKHVLHLHGELMKARSTVDEQLVYDIKGWELKLGDKCEKGSQLRPHIVWFGEAVPNMIQAIRITQGADIFAIIGTSLVVYPAAGLLDYVPLKIPIFLVDPNDVEIPLHRNITLIHEKAGKGVQTLMQKIINLPLNKS